jgi:hypothetical protein
MNHAANSTSDPLRPSDKLVRPIAASRSRRALLAGAVGGAAAFALQALARPKAARAEGEAMVVGGDYLTATSETFLANETNGANVFGAESAAGGTALRGVSHSGFAIQGQSNSSYGVYASSNSGTGVYGATGTGTGVFGSSASSTQPATAGRATQSGTGVLGFSTTSAFALPAAKAKTGVYGYAAQDSNANGVYGESPSGRAVRGKTTTGYAGYFEGKVYSTKWYELTEITTPPNPIANRARLFIRESGLGKTQVCVKFANGTVKVLATEG